MSMKEQVESMIKQADYWRVPNTNTTVCCLTFKNGFTEIGVCHDFDEYDEVESSRVAYENAINNSLRYLAWQQKDSKLEESIREQVRDEVTKDIRSKVNDFLSDLYSCPILCEQSLNDKQLTIDACDLWIKMAKEDFSWTTMQGVINSRYAEEDRLEYAHRLAKRFSELFYTTLEIKVRKGIIHFKMHQNKVNQEARDVFCECIEAPNQAVDFIFNTGLTDEQASHAVAILEHVGLDVNYDMTLLGGDATYWENSNTGKQIR